MRVWSQPQVHSESGLHEILNNYYTQNNLDEMDKVLEGYKLPRPTKEGPATGEVLGLFKGLNSYFYTLRRKAFGPDASIMIFSQISKKEIMILFQNIKMDLIFPRSVSIPRISDTIMVGTLCIKVGGQCSLECRYKNPQQNTSKLSPAK